MSSEMIQLRLVFDPSSAKALRTFAVYQAGVLVANGFAGRNGVYMALMDKPSLWYYRPASDVPSALRSVLCAQACEIVVEGEPAQATPESGAA